MNSASLRLFGLGIQNQGHLLTHEDDMKSRAEELQNISGEQFDLCVIGGGATGSACALDAQLRGIRTVLLEADDFAGATSSAATKVIHGGVRAHLF
jgi:NADPH-dependent 2,4-dienoyl-CoA reductase/sulfur reductase-like enzyme